MASSREMRPHLSANTVEHKITLNNNIQTENAAKRITQTRECFRGIIMQNDVLYNVAKKLGITKLASK